MSSPGRKIISFLSVALMSPACGSLTPPHTHTLNSRFFHGNPSPSFVDTDSERDFLHFSMPACNRRPCATVHLHGKDPALFFFLHSQLSGEDAWGVESTFLFTFVRNYSSLTLQPSLRFSDLRARSSCGMPPTKRPTSSSSSTASTRSVTRSAASASFWTRSSSFLQRPTRMLTSLSTLSLPAPACPRLSRMALSPMTF